MHCLAGSRTPDSSSLESPECRFCRRLGLCSLQAKATNYSDQFGFPVQFLQLCVELAILLPKLIHLRLEFSDRNSRDESHLRLRVTVLSCACGLGDPSQEIAALAHYVTFGDASEIVRLLSNAVRELERLIALTSSSRREKARSVSASSSVVSSAGCSPSWTRADRISRFLIS